jgi:hypothetical protein
MTTIDQIDEFSVFAKERLGSEPDRSMDELYEEWRRRAFKDVDALAILASLRDLKNGERGQPVEEFLAEFDAERDQGTSD